jgi:coenzyme F420-reducing hydrogenase beta subunit
MGNLVCSLVYHKWTPDTTAEAKDQMVCERCGETETWPVAKICAKFGHDYLNGKCRRCGELACQADCRHHKELEMSKAGVLLMVKRHALRRKEVV